MTAPPLAREMPDGSRMYEHPVTGARVPSVTTIIKAGFPKPRLADWAARMAAEYAVSHRTELAPMSVAEQVEQIRWAHKRYADGKAELGNAVHAVIDAWAKGEPHETPKAALSQVTRFTDFMMAVKPRFLETEVTLWSHEHRYAGTADWIADIGGIIYLGDNKTGRGVYAEAALQLAALAGCDVILREDGTEEEVPALEKLAVLHLRPRSWKLIPIEHADESFAAFLAARLIWDWNNDVAPVALGVM